MSQSILRGNVDSQSWISNPDTRVRFVDPKVFFAQAEIAPLLSLMEKFKRSVKASAITVETVEKDIGTPVTLVVGNVAGSATTINVTAGTGNMFTSGDVLWIPSTDEQILVTSVATDAITVPAITSAIASGAEVVKLSSAHAENASSQAGIALNPTMPQNIMQIHRTSIDLSRTNMQISRYGDANNALQSAKKDAMVLHMEGVERAYINGAVSLASDTRRTSKGILRFITTHRENMNGAFTKSKFDSFLKDVMFNGGGNYHLLASGTLLEAINQEVLTNSNMQITPATKEWGLDVRKYTSPFGTLNIVYARVLSHILEGLYGGCGMLINFNLLTRYYLQQTLYRPNIQANDVDGRKDEYLEETCPMLHNEANHGFIYGA